MARSIPDDNLALAVLVEGQRMTGSGFYFKSNRTPVPGDGRQVGRRAAGRPGRHPAGESRHSAAKVLRFGADPEGVKNCGGGAGNRRRRFGRGHWVGAAVALRRF